jgi:hypothetical protein
MPFVLSIVQSIEEKAILAMPMPDKGKKNIYRPIKICLQITQEILIFQFGPFGRRFIVYG